VLLFTQNTKNIIYVSTPEYSSDDGNYTVFRFTNDMTGVTCTTWVNNSALKVENSNPMYRYCIEDKQTGVLSEITGEIKFPNVGFYTYEIIKSNVALAIGTPPNILEKGKAYVKGADEEVSYKEHVNTTTNYLYVKD
tara:strand:+ start:2164 stop:2574 length:411 start_codon:yes stop_codon:yes gene_type:complete